MSRKDVLSQAAEMHYGFESIHPFSDGNGRVGRLLLNIHFLNHNWPFISILPFERDAYLDALEHAHSHETSELTQFLEASMARSLLFILDKVGTEEDRLLTLKELSAVTGTEYSPKYIALRISQGKLPGVRTNNLWKSSQAAILLYRETRYSK